MNRFVRTRLVPAAGAAALAFTGALTGATTAYAAPEPTYTCQIVEYTDLAKSAGGFECEPSNGAPSSGAAKKFVIRNHEGVRGIFCQAGDAFGNSPVKIFGSDCFQRRS